jgi:hypothetical protein
MWKRITFSALVLLFLAALVGCSPAARMITEKSLGERTDIFTETTDTGAPPHGFSDVVVKATLKTHHEGHYLLERRHDPHGKPEYRFMLNIDGQAAVWKVDGKKEDLPTSDEHGKTSINPDAGKGIKYVLEKRLRFRPGSHTISFGLPADNYLLERTVTMKEGETTVLEYKPVYRYKTLPTRIPTFMKGISHYEVYLNGTKL